MLEVKNFQTLIHPNIIKMHNYTSENNQLWIVFEYADAGDLDLFLRDITLKGTASIEDEERKFEQKVANMKEHAQIMGSKCEMSIKMLRMFLSICKGVHYMHQKFFIHRDLKPKNIFLKTCEHEPESELLEIKIGDLGTTKNLEMTMAKTKIGTELYAAPEFFFD